MNYWTLILCCLLVEFCTPHKCETNTRNDDNYPPKDEKRIQEVKLMVQNAKRKELEAKMDREKSETSEFANVKEEDDAETENSHDNPNTNEDVKDGSVNSDTGKNGKTDTADDKKLHINGDTNENTLDSRVSKENNRDVLDDHKLKTKEKEKHIKTDDLKTSIENKATDKPHQEASSDKETANDSSKAIKTEQIQYEQTLQQRKWIKRFNETVKFITKLDLYNKLQEILVHYIIHFTTYDKMSMKTRFGVKTVPLTEKINANLTIMAKWCIHIENTLGKSLNNKFNLTNTVNIFRFIFNNTVLLDKAIDHANGSFNFHHEVENPEKIRFYHELKKHKDFFQVSDINKSMDNVIKLLEDSEPTASDIATGNLDVENMSELNADECTVLADHVHAQNISLVAMFHEAALRRLEVRNLVVANKSQHLKSMINFYKSFGPVCNHRVETLQTILEDWFENNQTYPNEELSKDVVKAENDVDLEDIKCIEEIINQSRRHNQLVHDEL